MSWGFNWGKNWKKDAEYYRNLSIELAEENDKLKNKAVKLEQALKLKPRKKRRHNMTNKSGYTKVGKDESLMIYEMYTSGNTLLDIANFFKRSESCVSQHIRKHLEEDEDGEQMEETHRRKATGIKEEE